MKIGDKVKTTPKYAKEFAKEIAGVITKIDTHPKKIYETDSSGLSRKTNENHPTKTYTVAIVKTDAGNIRCIGIDWLMSVE
jgi:hypothetical protein